MADFAHARRLAAAALTVLAAFALAVRAAEGPATPSLNVLAATASASTSRTMRSSAIPQLRSGLNRLSWFPSDGKDRSRRNGIVSLSEGQRSVQLVLVFFFGEILQELHRLKNPGNGLAGAWRQGVVVIAL